MIAKGDKEKLSNKLASQDLHLHHRPKKIAYIFSFLFSSYWKVKQKRADMCQQGKGHGFIYILGLEVNNR